MSFAGAKQLPGPAAGRARLALTLVLIAAAMPVRLPNGFAFVRSISVLDIALIVVAATLVLDIAIRPIDVGYRELFFLLCLPLFLSVASLVWSADRAATMRAIFIYAEALVAYLFVIRELSGLPAGRIVLYVKRFSYLLIIPGILLLLHVPGFEPRVPGKHTAGGYLTYYTRLSHPVLGGSNNLATLLAFFVPILAYWGLSRHDRRATTAAFIATIAIFLTLSRGVLLAFLIAALLYAPLASRRLPARRSNLVPKIISAVAAGAVAIAIFTSIDPTAHQLFATRLSAANVESRTELISISLQKIALRPLLGYGGGVNPQLDPLSAYRADTGHTSALAVAPAQASSLSGTELDTHNAYLQQVIYFGLPLGLAMTLALWATVGVFVANRHAQALAGVIGYTILVQLVSFLFEASFEGTVLRVLFYMSIGLAVALLRSVEREETVTGEAAS